MPDGSAHRITALEQRGFLHEVAARQDASVLIRVPEPYGGTVPLMGALSWLVLILAVISLLVIAAKMVMAGMRRNGTDAAEGVSQIPWVLLAVCMIFLSVPFVGAILPESGIAGGLAATPDLLTQTGARGSGFRNGIDLIISWGKGIVTVLAVLGILWSAGRMALGRLGSSDLVVDGVGGVTWVVFGVSLMLLSSVIISGLSEIG
ncbi:hypothetical protein [Nocardiopsis sp. MG754419]|uniref:hypothetical protein n=1 Tax=Nocardiopsis sp. MG754419 TaxID=2259865 RepID=UPI001BA9CEBE|nr:hypothetical protein [Nocardiopsis sp. MG754419]MBR8741035.1 hypothetical protein [Nocardiopsis sp. MG754419]